MDPMALDDDELPAEFRRRPIGSNPARTWLWVTAVGALLGAAFAGVSTADFISHLDRQVHSIHCSFIPGASPQLGESGCRTVMMSPYSSLFRDAMWGGLPISLLAFAVFAYLIYRSADFALRDSVTKRDTGYLVVATLLPVLMSVVYGYISTSIIGSVCKLCVGVYASSALLLVGSLMAHSKAGPRGHQPAGGLYARWFAEGVAYVAVLTVLYIAFAPQNEKTLDGCGTLVDASDKSKIMLPFEGANGNTKAIAVLDPLCPACKAFDKRLAASGLLKKLDAQIVLFPLDSECNWMVKESLHPGACAVSEAMLCDRDKAGEILAWAFENQDELLAQAKKNPRDVQRSLKSKFPSVAGCVGKARVRNKLNKSLRWAVKNALPVLTPQLFVEKKRICDEDTDLGLEFTVSEMIARGGK